MSETVDLALLQRVLSDSIRARLEILNDAFRLCRTIVVDRRVTLDQVTELIIHSSISIEKMLDSLAQLVDQEREHVPTAKQHCWRRILQVLLEKRFWAILIDQFFAISIVDLESNYILTVACNSNSPQGRLIIYVKQAAAPVEKADLHDMASKSQQLHQPLQTSISSKIWTEIKHIPQTLWLFWNKPR